MPGAPRIELAPERKALARALRARGWSYDRIGALFGLSAWLVLREVPTARLSRDRPGPNRTRGCLSGRAARAAQQGAHSHNAGTRACPS